MVNESANSSKGNDKLLSEINFHHVDGEQKESIKLFALSTCGWCKKTRMFLEENNVAYDYIYVDLTEGAERELVVEEFQKYNPDMSFPTIVINGTKVIVGYEPEEMAREFDL